MKFGGTSVADLDRIRNVARHVKREVDAGYDVAVVVSAMSGVTNQLVAWCREAAPLHDAREYDAVVASGEQVTAGLLAIVLQGLGIQARSWQGWQIPIKTSDAHASARILEIDGAELISRFKDRKEVAVIAGFQGISPHTGRITTLGRGGSDTSAVALAAALRADRCDIFTDVDGVYTSNPRIVAKARKLDKITYEEMLEMASQGAKVLQTRSVEMAMNHSVRVQVLSSFTDAPGTFSDNPWIRHEDAVFAQLVTKGIPVFAASCGALAGKSVTSEPVPSVEPPSITMCSMASQCCALTLSIVRRNGSTALYATVMTDTKGWGADSGAPDVRSRTPPSRSVGNGASATRETGTRQVQLGRREALRGGRKRSTGTRHPRSADAKVPVDPGVDAIHDAKTWIPAARMAASDHTHRTQKATSGSGMAKWHRSLRPSCCKTGCNRSTSRQSASRIGQLRRRRRADDSSRRH